MIDLPPEYYYAKGKINFRCDLNGNNYGLNGLRSYFKDLGKDKAWLGWIDQIK